MALLSKRFFDRCLVTGVYTGIVLAVAGILGSYVPRAPRMFSRLADLALLTGAVLGGVSLVLLHWQLRRRGEPLPRGEFRRGDMWGQIIIGLLFPTIFIMVVVEFATSGGTVDQGSGGNVIGVTESLAMGVFGLLYLVSRVSN